MLEDRYCVQLLLVGCIVALALGSDPFVENDSSIIPLPVIRQLVSDMKGSAAKAYNLVDSTGQQMASLHVFNGTAKLNGTMAYVGTYMCMVGKTWEVRVATSTNLMKWNYVRSILPNADMPYLQTVPGTDSILLVHEQWMRPDSTSPSNLGFALYESLENLLTGSAAASYIAPLTLGNVTSLEGTPSIYWVKATSIAPLTVSACIGFHFNSPAGVDTVAGGFLEGLSVSSRTPPRWRTVFPQGYDDAFRKLGAVGNIGQRDYGSIGGHTVLVQEANIGHMPPTIWVDWRLWMYVPAPREPLPPTGAGTAVMLNITTDGGSVAFGNPSIRVVPCPADNRVGPLPSSEQQQCLFVSFFIFSEGAAPGEAGVAAFYHELPTNAT